MGVSRYESLVFRAIHSTSRKVQAKNGKTPYKVSLAECDRRSIARNTFMQKSVAARQTTAPGNDTGRERPPTRLNHACFIGLYLSGFVSQSEVLLKPDYPVFCCAQVSSFHGCYRSEVVLDACLERVA